MTTPLIIAGIVILLIVVPVLRLFNRIGKPVQQSLSDSYYYHRWKNKIIYSPMGNWFELGYTEMDADVETFTVLSRNFGKDKHTIYRKGKVQQTDHATFIIDAHGIPKDAFHVYYENSLSIEMTIISGADPKTYQPYQLPGDPYAYSWGKDHQSVFLYGKKIEADGKTFTRINKTLAVDALNLYAVITDFTSGSGTIESNTRVIRADKNEGGLYTAITDYYARNNNRILFSNWKTNFTSVEFDSVDTIRTINEENIVINNNTLLYAGHRLNDIDVASLEIINHAFLKDNAHVYFEGEKITSADPETFELIHEFYSKDKQRVFFKTKALDGLDPKTVRMDFGKQTLTDGTHKVKDGVLITGDQS